MHKSAVEVPMSRLAELRKNWKSDLISGYFTRQPNCCRDLT